MKISGGYENCPRCGYKNKMKKLFTTYFYEDCDVCGKVKAKEINYILTIYINSLVGDAKIRLVSIEKSGNMTKTTVKEEKHVDDMTRAMEYGETYLKRYSNRSRNDYNKLKWTTEYYNKGSHKITKSLKDGYILYRTEFKVYKIDDDDDDNILNMRLDFY